MDSGAVPCHAGRRGTAALERLRAEARRPGSALEPRRATPSVSRRAASASPARGRGDEVGEGKWPWGPRMRLAGPQRIFFAGLEAGLAPRWDYEVIPRCERGKETDAMRNYVIEGRLSLALVAFLAAVGLTPTSSAQDHRPVPAQKDGGRGQKGPPPVQRERGGGQDRPSPARGGRDGRARGGDTRGAGRDSGAVRSRGHARDRIQGSDALPGQHSGGPVLDRNGVPEPGQRAPGTRGLDDRAARSVIELERVHRDRMARIDRLTNIYRDRGDARRLKELARLRERERTIYDRTMALHEREFGTDRVRRVRTAIAPSDRRGTGNRPEPSSRRASDQAGGSASRERNAADRERSRPSGRADGRASSRGGERRPEPARGGGNGDGGPAGGGKGSGGDRPRD